MAFEVNRDGFATVPEVLDLATIHALRAELDAVCGGMHPVSRRGTAAFAVRNLLCVSPMVRALAQSAPIRRLMEPYVGEDCAAVRGILFDKTPGANWKVIWHQDLSIAVREKHFIAGWGPWSVKAGVIHVQPPPEILERMLTIRLHLDDCGATNGPLRVLPGTHNRGRLGPAQIASLREATPEKVCTVGAGDALLMRPLLLHASSEAHKGSVHSAPCTSGPRHRRVLHLEFAAGKLPPPLEWEEQAGQTNFGAIRDDSR